MSLSAAFDLGVLQRAMVWLVPTGLAILVASFWFSDSWRAHHPTRLGSFMPVKMASGLVLVGMQAINIAFWRSTKYFPSPVAINASSMSLIASVCTVAIIAATHRCRVQPSALVSPFFFLTALFDAAMARSFFLKDSPGSFITSFQCCVVLLKIFIIILEELSKRDLQPFENLTFAAAAEAAVGDRNSSRLIWLNPLLFLGWRKNFSVNNLPEIGPEFASERLFHRFSSNWTEANKSSKFALLITLLRTLKWQFVPALAARLLYTVFTLAQPFLLLHVVQAVSRGHISLSTSSNLIIACGGIYFGLATTRNFFQRWDHQVATSARGIFVVAIYDKTQKLSSEALKSDSAINLVSTDIESTEYLISTLSESWSSIIQAILGSWALYTFIGPACFLIILSISATFLGTVLVSERLSGAKAACDAGTEKRVSTTSNALAQLKDLKSMGLSGSLSKYLEEEHDAEVVAVVHRAYTHFWNFAFGAINFTVAPAITFAGAYFWTRADDPMTVAEVFTIMAILAICSNPFVSLFPVVPVFSSDLASMMRIQAFLLQNERVDPRDIPMQMGTGGERELPDTNRDEFAFDLDNVSVTSPIFGPILREITFTIPWGSHAMMWGPMNSGKSTLLKVLLGEIELNEGSISAGTKDIAYCSQEVWIEDGTIQQAIIGALPFSQPFYNEILTACALDSDVQAMTAGDQTKTGSNGCNLDESQRQRLCLARGAYARKEVMILDNLFGSVDPEMAGLIFSRLFGSDGIVRRWDCTVITTTNRLELLDFADQIFRFSRNGRLQEEHDTESDSSSTFAESAEESSDAEHAVSNAGRSAEETALPAVQTKEHDNGAQSSSETLSDDLSVYKYFISSVGSLTITIWICFAMFGAAGEWMPMIFLRICFVRNPQDQTSFTSYAILSVASIALNVLNAAFFFTLILPKTAKEMHRRLRQAVLGATPEFVSETDPSSLLKKFNQDITHSTFDVANRMNQFVFLGFTTLIEVGMIAAGSPYPLPVGLFMLLSMFIVHLLHLRSFRRLRQLEEEASSSISTRFKVTSEGIHHIRSFGWQGSFRQRLFAELDQSQKPTYVLHCIERWLTTTMDLLTAAVSLVLVTLLLKRPDSTSEAAVGLAMLTLIGFSNTAENHIGLCTIFETNFDAIRRILLFESETPQEQDTLSGPPLPKDWPANGRIDFSDVTSTYTTNDGSSRTALDNVTMTIHPGQKIGIMGRPGSGKSSVLAAILRMVDFSGHVSIDGRNTKSVPRELLRSRITTITQEGLRLKSTLRFNMYPFEGVQPTDNQIIDVLRTVDLLNHVNLHGGLDAQYSAIRFSSIQKQLMFLARGILHQRITDTNIIMIDELTSSLPVDMEDDVQDIIDRAFTGCTILLVSRRQESFLTTDFVLRFRSGKLYSTIQRNNTGGWSEV